MISLKSTLEAITKALSVDYIVEQGTSGIWTYRKWNSGIAECWGTQTASVNITVTWFSSGYYSYYTALPNYPVSFLDLPTVSLTASSQDGRCWGYPVRELLTKTNIGKIVLVSLGSYTDVMTKIDIYAIGRWK